MECPLLSVWSSMLYEPEGLAGFIEAYGHRLAGTRLAVGCNLQEVPAFWSGPDTDMPSSQARLGIAVCIVDNSLTA